MKLRVLTRHAKMELLFAEDDVCSLLFEGRRQQHACRLFLNFLKVNGGCTRAELNKFSHDLWAGRIEKGFRYSRAGFYKYVRSTLLMLGLVAIEQRFVGNPEQDLEPERHRHRDVVEKYVPVRQPIPKRPPDGLNLPRLMWTICKRWNDEFLEGR